MSAETGKVAFSTKFYYGFGSIAYGVKDNGFSYLLLIYYNQVLGLPATWVGLAIMVALIFDSLSDPIVGTVSDNWHSRWARRHPFMYFSAVPVAVSFFFLWNPPRGLTDGQLFIYLVIVSILVRTCITLYEIPSTSLVAELTDDYDQRTSMLTYRYFFGWWGGLTMMSLAFLIFLRPTAEYPNGTLNPGGYQTYGLVSSLIIIIAILVSSIGTHRHIPHLKQPPAKRPFNIVRIFGELKETLNNRSFAALLASGLFSAVVIGLMTSLYIYFATFFWELSNQQMFVLTLMGFISAIVAGIVTPRLGARLGKKSAAIGVYSLSIVIGPLPYLLRLLDIMPSNQSPMLVPVLMVYYIVNISLAISTGILISSMVADVVEESEINTGRRSEGVFFAARTFIMKAVNGIGVLMATLLLNLVDFPKGAKPGEVDPDIIANLAVAYIPATTLFAVLSLAAIGFYGISKDRHQQNLQTLAGQEAPETK